MRGFYTANRLELTIYGYDSKLSHELALFLYNIIYSNTYFRKRMSTANRLSLDMMLPKIQPKERLKAMEFLLHLR